MFKNSVYNNFCGNHTVSKLYNLNDDAEIEICVDYEWLKRLVGWTDGLGNSLKSYSYVALVVTSFPHKEMGHKYIILTWPKELGIQWVLEMGIELLCLIRYCGLFMQMWKNKKPKKKVMCMDVIIYLIISNYAHKLQSQCYINITWLTLFHKEHTHTSSLFFKRVESDKREERRNKRREGQPICW